jgi:predicted amidohydrolase
MRDIRIATAQFEHRDGDKAYNLDRIADLARRAAEQWAEIVCFHECSIPGYTWLQTLDREGLLDVAEPVPDGPSVARLAEIARSCKIVVMAGHIERDAEDRCFNAYVAVDASGRIRLHHRKLHTFINPHLSPGDRYTVAEFDGVRIGCLICYDNNLPENVRVTTLMGAEVIIMPHVTGCTPSTMPGRGVVDPALWDNRQRDPARLRLEFRGPKGRGWLMRWLPARAWENGVYAVFSNPIGRDGDTIKPGLSMILDPHGEVVCESNELGDDVVVGLLTSEALEKASGRRYLAARRPELYGKLVEPLPPGTRSVTKPGWALAYEDRASGPSGRGSSSSPPR